MKRKEYKELLEAYKNVYEQQIGIPLKEPTDRAAKEQLQKMIPKGEKVEIFKSTLQKSDYEYEDLYDEVLDYLINEGYSHEEATRIMVDENWLQDILGVAKKRLSTPLKTAATDAAATAIATTPAQSVRPALPPQPAPIVRQVAAAVKPNPLQQLKAPVKNVINVVRQLKSAKPPAGSLPQGKPGGNIIPSSKPGVVTPSTKPASEITNASRSSSVATSARGGQVSPSGTSVRAPGGSLAKAGPVINVQPTLSGTPSVQRLSSSQVRNFKPSVKVSPTPAAVSGSTASNLIGALKYGPHVAAAAIGLNAGPVADGTLKGKDLNAFKPGPEQGVGVKPRVAAPYTPPRPTASKTPEKKVEVNPKVKPKVSEKPKLSSSVKKPASVKPVDSDLQRYQKLRTTDPAKAKELGTKIWLKKYGAPTEGDIA